MHHIVKLYRFHGYVNTRFRGYVNTRFRGYVNTHTHRMLHDSFLIDRLLRVAGRGSVMDASPGLVATGVRSGANFRGNGLIFLVDLHSR